MFSVWENYVHISAIGQNELCIPLTNNSDKQANLNSFVPQLVDRSTAGLKQHSNNMAAE